MKYALDTNIISYILRGDKKVKQRWLQEEKKGNHSVIPLIVFYEVRRGLLANNAIVKMHSFEELCVEFGVHDLCLEDMKAAAEIYANCKRLGKPINDADILIAAQCATNGYVLVTHNIKHFEGIDKLHIEDWAE